MTLEDLTNALALAAVGGLPFSSARAAEPAPVIVGRQPNGSVVVPTHQRITPAGRQVELPGQDAGSRVRFVVKTGRNAQNAPGRSNTREVSIA